MCTSWKIVNREVSLESFFCSSWKSCSLWPQASRCSNQTGCFFWKGALWILKKFNTFICWNFFFSGSWFFPCYVFCNYSWQIYLDQLIAEESINFSHWFWFDYRLLFSQDTLSSSRWRGAWKEGLFLSFPMFSNLYLWAICGT